MNPYNFKDGFIISVIPEYDDVDIAQLNGSAYDNNRSFVDFIRIITCISNNSKYDKVYIYNILHYGHTFIIFYINKID